MFLKESADSSRRRKAPSFRSTMSMLVFYINRTGKNLGKKQMSILEQAKHELCRVGYTVRPDKIKELYKRRTKRGKTLLARLWKETRK